LASALGIPSNQVEIVAGASSRSKVVDVGDIELASVEDALMRAAENSG
jgi:uncharacterized protein YggU (UPF0235/DUF167 family)